MTLGVESVAHCYDVAQAQGIARSDRPLGLPPRSSLIVYDPDGVAIELTDFRAATVEPVAYAGELGVRSWLYTQVRVSEMARSIQWYEELFGFAVVAELHLEGAPIEQSTGLPGVKVRMVQGDIGGVQIELIETQGADGFAGRGGIRVPGELGGITLSVEDVYRSYEVARHLDIRSETDGPVAYPPTPYHSLIIQDPDGVRYDLTDYRVQS